MSKYYVNKNAQDTGEHEVHCEGCQWMPLAKNLIYLGNFSSCKAAIDEAKKYYTNVDGCMHCSLTCHTR